MHNLIIDLIPNDRKHIANQTSQKVLLKNFCYNNKGTRKVKFFQKLSNKSILQQIFKIYISWPNLMDGIKPYSQCRYWEKCFHCWSIKCYYGSIFSIWYKFVHFPPLKPYNI